MTAYSQRDPQWADNLINGTYSTLKRFGCLITCFGIVTDTPPDKVNVLFEEKGAYSSDLVAWGGVPNALPLDLVSRPQDYDNQKVLDVIAREGFCIVEVDFDGVIASTADTHWVVYIGDHKCIDPWDGGTKPTSAYPIAKRYVDFHKRPPVTSPVPPIVLIVDPQAKLDLGEDFGVMELQAVRSTLRDQTKTIKDQKQTIDGLTATLQAENPPVGTVYVKSWWLYSLYFKLFKRTVS